MIGDEEELDKYLIKIVEETSDGGIFDDMEIEISQEDDFNEENEESTEKKKITQFIEQDMFPHLGVSSTHEEKAILLGKMVRKLLLVNETSINANKFAQRATTKQTKQTKCIIHKKIVTIILINVLKQPEFYVLNYFVCYTKDL